jgi:chromosomal replication initiation ATPase DnaA
MVTTNPQLIDNLVDELQLFSQSHDRIIVRAFNKSDIIDIVCQFFEVSKHDIFKKCRKQCFTIPRYCVMYFFKYELKLSYKSIGMEFQRDHSTVINAVQVINDMIEYDKHFKKRFDILSTYVTDRKKMLGE